MLQIRQLEDLSRSESDATRKEREQLSNNLRIAQTEARSHHAEAVEWRRKYEIEAKSHEQSKVVFERETEKEKSQLEEKFKLQLQKKVPFLIPTLTLKYA